MVSISPRANDVLFGRGAITNSHPGNQQFRSLVNSQKGNFLREKNKKLKRDIAVQIFYTIQSLQPPGRFLVEDRSADATRTDDSNDSVVSSPNVHPNLLKKTWSVVEREKALEKIMHRLRERVDIDVAAMPQVQMSVAEDDLDEECQSGDTSIGQLRNYDEVQPQGIACGLPAELSMPSNFLCNPNFRSLDSRPTDENACIERQVTETSTRNGQTANVLSSSRLDLFNSLEGSEIDLDLDRLGWDLARPLDYDSSQQLNEYTLQQWIELASPDFGSGSGTAVYIESSLQIALKLIEYILEAEKDELDGHVNPIPLASIVPENVVLGAKKGQHAVGESDEAQGIIEYVWIMSIIGDDSATGGILERLFAVGHILYYLFSAGVVPMIDDITTAYQKASMNSINLSNEDARHNSHAQKKHHPREAQADKRICDCVESLESTGIPQSLCALIRNLFDCSLGSFCEDDAYASFSDLRVDLQLMVQNPSCFLDNICITSMPKITMDDKLYGRDDEMVKLNDLHMRHRIEKSFIGTIISGEAGVGKSKLAIYIQTLTKQSDEYFLSAKFELHQMSLKPLSVIANMFNSLCDMIFNDSTESELKLIKVELANAFGNQSNLSFVVPNLKKLMPSRAHVDNSTSRCVDSAVSMRYLLSELLRVISSHSKPITIVIDDVQFADPASLLLLGNLLFSAQGAPIFFVLCHRDDEASKSGPFNIWLSSINMFMLEQLQLASFTPDAVNNLMSETLHLCPRLTRPLSSVLHHKTRGNPLFLKQLLDSLAEQGYIYVDLKRHRWCWDLDKIMELEISGDVLALLMNDVQRLPHDLQFGLQIASCIGSCVTASVLDYLSLEFGLDLKDILRQASQKGFVNDIAGSTMFRFAHDQIQEAVYETMPDQQRRENHMRIGLALCTRSLNGFADDDDLFYAAVNQINQGGPAAVHESSQNNIIAELNMKAGRRSIELSDYNTAFTLFVHGISFLGENHWLSNYELSLDLYNAVTTVSLILNKISAVKLYSNEVVLHARCFDDKLHCLITTAEAIGIVALNPIQSIQASFAILTQCGEDLPRSMADDKLVTDIDKMNLILQGTPDEIICNMQENNDAKMTILLDLYVYLGHVLQFFKPWLVGSVSLRMIELTIKTGLSAKSPLTFAHFGGVLVTSGRIKEGCRLGRLALKLVERKGSLQFKSRVIRIVYDRISWASEPLQSIVEAFSLGHKAGHLSGDVLYAFNNLLLAIFIDYFSGQHLDVVQKVLLDFIAKLQRHGVKIFFKDTVLLLSQIMVLKEGLYMSSLSHADKMPSEDKILAESASGSPFSSYVEVHHLTRAFLFRQVEDASFQIDICGAVAKSHHLLNVHYLMGFFFEGLASFQLARNTISSQATKWIERGRSVLTKMQCWSEHSLWNWENKMLLLEAESLFTNGDFDSAGSLYISAVRSAREHKFIHEEAIASELGGIFYYRRNLRQMAFSFLVHAVDSYKKWGAHAVARRVETDIRDYFGNDIDQHVSSSSADTSLEYLITSSQGSKKKRQQD